MVDSLDVETADHLLETLSTMIEWLIKKKEQGIDVRLVEAYLPNLLNFLLKCESSYIVYDL